MFTRTVTVPLVVLALAGCSAQSVANVSIPSHSASESESESASASSTLAPSPTPTVMTMTEAIAAYKVGACRVNMVGQSFNQIWQSGSGDLAGLQRAAATSRDAVSTTASELDKGKWPAELQTDIALVRDADFAQASVLAQIATSTTWYSAMATAFPAQDDAAAASQRIRSRLGLPADPLAGC